VNSKNNNTDKDNIQNKQQNAQSNCHCPMPRALPSHDWLPLPSQLPPTRTQHAGTWYQIPCFVWPVWVSPPGRVPSWILVKTNPVLAEPWTSFNYASIDFILFLHVMIRTGLFLELLADSGT